MQTITHTIKINYRKSSNSSACPNYDAPPIFRYNLELWVLQIIRILSVNYKLFAFQITKDSQTKGQAKNLEVTRGLAMF